MRSGGEKLTFEQKVYSAPARVREHYRNQHEFEYRLHTPGGLYGPDKQVHEEGLDWLARFVAFGVEGSGPRPLPAKS